MSTCVGNLMGHQAVSWGVLISLDTGGISELEF